MTTYQFQIEVIPGQLQALFKVSPSLTGQVLNRRQILIFLKDQGIKFGILEENISLLINNPQQSSVLIAQGVEAKKGSNAHFKVLLSKDDLAFQNIIYNTEKIPDITPEMLENISLKSGTALIKKVPATQGAPGCNVFGHIVSGMDGKDLPWPKLKNCVISDDDLFIEAQVSGVPLLQLPDKVSIQPLMSYNRTIETSQRHNGITLIFGNISNHIRLFSASDIIIFGTIDASFICSESGSILVFGGVKGKGHAVLKAHQNIHIDFAEQSTLEAGGSIYIDSALQSHLISLNTIEAKAILNSECWALGKVTADKVGQDSIINVAKTDYLQMVLDNTNKNLDTVFNSLNYYLKEQSKAASEIYNLHIKIRLSHLKTQQQTLLKKQKELTEKMKLMPKGLIRIQDQIELDSVIQVSQMELVLKETKKGPVAFYPGKYGILTEIQKEANK